MKPLSHGGHAISLDFDHPLSYYTRKKVTYELVTASIIIGGALQVNDLILALLAQNNGFGQPLTVEYCYMTC